MGDTGRAVREDGAAFVQGGGWECPSQDPGL